MNQWGGNVEDLFNSSRDWPSTWTASDSGVSRTFCIKPGASGCLGDAGNYSYSTDDWRLFSDSSSSSYSYFRGGNVHNAAKNLVLNIAQAARRDATLGGVNVHAIGLGGYGYDADASLMKRMANDPSDSYGVTVTTFPDEPQGSYTYAPSVGELQEAFNKVRSEVMRLTK